MKIFIDPGHGGTDPGAVYPGKIFEKDLNLKIALKVKDILSGNSAVCVLTRGTDVDLSIGDRLKIEGMANYDACISIHCNAAASTDAHGFEVCHWYKSKSGMLLSDAIYARAKIAGLHCRPPYLADDNPQTYERDLAMVHKTKAPAVLVECGFGSNPLDLLRLTNEGTQQAVAAVIANGVLDWFKRPQWPNE